MMLETFQIRLREWLLDNLGLKVISFLFAVALWGYVSSRGEVEINFVVPLELRNVPKNLQVVDLDSEQITVRLRGRQVSIRSLRPEQIHVNLDLRDIRPGWNTYTLDHRAVQLPVGIDVIQVNPKTVRIQTVRILERQVPIRVALEGRPAPGYRVAEVQVEPSVLSIRGLEHELSRIHEIHTQPVNLQGKEASFTETVALQSLPPGITPVKGIQEVRVQVQIVPNPPVSPKDG